MFLVGGCARVCEECNGALLKNEGNFLFTVMKMGNGSAVKSSMHLRKYTRRLVICDDAFPTKGLPMKT